MAVSVWVALAAAMVLAWWSGWLCRSVVVARREERAARRQWAEVEELFAGQARHCHVVRALPR